MFYDLKIINEEDGILVPLEFFELPFKPKRIFYVCGVPKDEERGRHAHFKTQQLLICVQGEILVKLHNGHKLSKYTLFANQSILVDKMIWDSQVFKTGNDVLLSICSTNYEKLDYIEDFNKFLKIVGA